MRNRAFITVMVALAMCSGLAPSAQAWGRHNSQRVHVKVKKNNGPFGISLKAKKQKKPKGYYRETLTGRRVY
jgi:hypothetical protein